MIQLNFLPSDLTTAIYPNRKKDKIRVEAENKIAELGNDTTKLFLKGNPSFQISEGYKRAVYGDHGPYVEFEKQHLVVKLKRKFNRKLPKDAYYEWLCILEFPNLKIYDQKRNVKHLPNPPGHGFRGNRKEGYADYLPGKIYISAWDLQTNF